MGTLYVLDEPSIGLHARDNQRLSTSSSQLREQGNTVLVVEHDEDMIRVADHVVDIGLGAGEQGGRVVYSGLRGPAAGAAIADGEVSTGELDDPSAVRAASGPGAEDSPNGATEHNLKGVDIDVMLNTYDLHHRRLGFGKIHARARRSPTRPSSGRRRGIARGRALIAGRKQGITEVVMVDQSPIGRTPR